MGATRQTLELEGKREGEWARKDTNEKARLYMYSKIRDVLP